jgi:hypothetical protein
MSAWQNPKGDAAIRQEGSLRILHIMEKGVGERARDKRREYRVMLALERLCYEHAKSRDEYTDESKFKVLLHRMAAEKAKRRRGRQWSDGTQPPSHPFGLHDISTGTESEMKHESSAPPGTFVFAQPGGAPYDAMMAGGQVFSFPQQQVMDGGQGYAMNMNTMGGHPLVFFVAPPQPSQPPPHQQHQVAADEVREDNPRPKQRARTAPLLPVFGGVAQMQTGEPQQQQQQQQLLLPPQQQQQFLFQQQQQQQQYLMQQQLQQQPRPQMYAPQSMAAQEQQDQVGSQPFTGLSYRRNDNDDTMKIPGR